MVKDKGGLKPFYAAIFVRDEFRFKVKN